MKFKAYMLTEATTDLHELAVELANSMKTIMPPEKYSTTKADKLIDAVDEIAAGIKDDKIYNAAWTDAKSTIYYRFEELYSSLYYRKIAADYDGDKNHNYNPNMHRWVLDNYDISPNINANNIKSQLKLIDKVLPKLNGHDKKHAEELGEMLKKFELISDGIKSLKSKTIKGRKPTEPDPNAFYNKVGSKDAQELVRKHLLANITPSLDEYEKEMTKFFKSEIDDLASRTEINGNSLDGLTQIVLQSCFDYKVEYDKGRVGNRTYVIKGKNDRAVGWPAAEAGRMRKSMEEGFLAKNIRKLSNIIDLKGNLTKITDLPSKPVKVSKGRGSLEAGFKFLFNDSAEFSVVNKIITNYSMRGLPFYQYPTTFHDVKLADGKKLSMPSEEKMVKDFPK